MTERQRRRRQRTSGSEPFRGQRGVFELVDHSSMKGEECPVLHCKMKCDASGDNFHVFCAKHKNFKICDNAYCDYGSAVKSVISTENRYRYEHFFCEECIQKLDKITPDQMSNTMLVSSRLLQDRRNTQLNKTDIKRKPSKKRQQKRKERAIKHQANKEI